MYSRYCRFCISKNLAFADAKALYDYSYKITQNPQVRQLFYGMIRCAQAHGNKNSLNVHFEYCGVGFTFSGFPNL